MNIGTADNVSRPESLSAFGHHPDPAIDFCHEVDVLEAELVDRRARMPSQFDLRKRIARAMDFRVGGNEMAIRAKSRLRQLENEAVDLDAPLH